MYYGALPIHFELAKNLRENQTEAEIFLWSQFEHVNIPGVRIKRQHPILYFIADFYCHQAKLILKLMVVITIHPSSSAMTSTEMLN